MVNKIENLQIDFDSKCRHIIFAAGRSLVCLFVCLIACVTFSMVCAKVPQKVDGELRHLCCDGNDWTEIATYGNFSLIIGLEVIDKQFRPFDSGNTYKGYQNSLSKQSLDNWFSSLPSNSKLKTYAVGNTAVQNLGCYIDINDPYYSRVYSCNGTSEALGTGYSLPDDNLPAGPMLLSYQEAETFLYPFVSKHNTIVPCWLRSPGNNINSGAYFGTLMLGKYIQKCPLNLKRGILPALWVKRAFFGGVSSSVSSSQEVVLSVEEILSDLNDMVGLDEVKNLMEELIITAQQRKIDKSCGLSVSVSPSYHMIITGNPGTGKTTLARKLSKIFHEAGIISEDKFIQVERQDLVDKYIGGTEEKVKSIIQSAEGGVLFIDEAYSLVGEGKDVGRHVIEGMLSAMTDNKCIVVAAGYPDKMEEFLRMNAGLARRFTYHVNLPNYNEDQLFGIFLKLCSKNNLVLEDSEEIRRIFSEYFSVKKELPGFGNAGDVNTFFEAVIMKRSFRLSKEKATSREVRQYIKVQDVADAVESHPLSPRSDDST